MLRDDFDGEEPLELPLVSARTLTVYVCLSLSDDHYDISLSGRLLRSPQTHLSLPQLRSHAVCLSVCPADSPFVLLFPPHPPHPPPSSSVSLYWPVVVFLLNLNKDLRQCGPPIHSTFWLGSLNGDNIHLGSLCMFVWRWHLSLLLICCVFVGASAREWKMCFIHLIMY